ncbi:hypothetical protein BJY04DRAFT_223838 [Aspergillus karnatakaensis]|uniref:uncharacterized protein n=1 Tax=Aspergillus karnatakaensis TaxID=1810916 RepID=UPI003CCD0593
MSLDKYVQIVDGLATAQFAASIGEGTVGNPYVHWLCDLDREQGRVALDHKCTRSYVGFGDHREEVYEEDDPHLTVYMGNSESYVYEAHIYVTYHKGSRVPSRLAHPSERRTTQVLNGYPVSILDRTELRAKARRFNRVAE